MDDGADPLGADESARDGCGDDTKRLVQQLADMRANVAADRHGRDRRVLSDKVPFHYPSPYLPAGRDMFGDMLREAHARSIRVVGRYDFSKTPKAAYELTRSGFSGKRTARPVIYNGLYSTCITGGYYREQAMKILTEALRTTMSMACSSTCSAISRPTTAATTSGYAIATVAGAKYREDVQREIPDAADDEYRQFLLTSSREVAAAIGKLIREKRPESGLLQLHAGVHRRHHVGVEHGCEAAPSAVALLGERQREPRAEQPTREDGDQSEYAVRRFLLAVRDSPAERDRAPYVAEHRARRSADVRSERHDRPAGPAGDTKPRGPFSAGWRHEQYLCGAGSAARVLLLGGRRHAEPDDGPIAACSAC